ncbi:Leucine Rich repeats (2 copies) [compost metagenome]
MATPTQEHPPKGNTLAMEQAYQDSLIVNRMPRWIRRLRIVSPTEQDYPVDGLYASEHAALCEAMRDSVDCRQLLKAAMAGIQGIDHFCAPLLQKAMLDTFGSTHAIKGLYFRSWYTYTAPKQGISWGGYPLMEKDYFEVPLIQAALENFTEGEGRNEQPRDNCIVDASSRRIASPSAPEFARMCRKLDLGARYQRHLDSVLNAPASQAGGWHTVASTLARQYRSVMLIDACKAKTEGGLNAAELKLISDLCKQGRPGTFYEAKVVVRQLKAFDCMLQQIVVLEVLHEGWLFNSSRRIIVYIPGDPHGPWTVSKDLETFVRKVLSKRLRTTAYQAFFKRFVRRRDSCTFFSKVAQELVDVVDTATREMDQHMVDYPLPLFDHLASQRIAQIKDDAAQIATPVANIDRQLQEAHKKWLEAEGWTLAIIAGLFIPMLNTLLLALMAWDMLDELFQAVEDWREGDTNAALDHVLNLTKELAVVGVTAVVWREASRAWTALDHWVPARLEDGTHKLWNGDLVPFRTSAPPAGAVTDAAGIYRAQDKCWINMDGYFYEIVQRGDEEWQLAARQGHGPLLRHNEAGAWRRWTEQTASWTDAHAMCRRLGEPFSRLDEEDIDRLMTIHALDADHLRALHVYGRPAEAELVDSAERLLIHRRVQALLNGLRLARGLDDAQLLAMARSLPGVTEQEGPALAEQVWARRRQLFQHVYDQQQGSDDAAVATLRHVFPRLHYKAAQQLLKVATDSERQYLERQTKVPFGLTRKARVSVLRIRVALACEALLIDTPQSLDLAKVALTLLETLPGSELAPHWRLFDGDAFEPVLSVGRGLSFRLVHRDGLFELEDALGLRLHPPGELFEVMASALETGAIEQLGLSVPYAESLRAALARQVSGRTQMVAQALGKNPEQPTWSAPQRLEDGRIGYPLGGGGVGGFARPSSRPRALAARLRDLYPAYSDEQVEQWLVRLHAVGRDVAAELGMLEQQAGLLYRHLKTWELNGLLAGEKAERRRFRRALTECWRELVPERVIDPSNGLSVNWEYVGHSLRSLPDLPPQVSFPHVTGIALRHLKLTEIPDTFLLGFPNVTALELTNNRLQRLPPNLALLSRLRVIDLSNNRVRLDEAQCIELVQCRNLSYLNLSHNPLYRSISVTNMSQLRELRLRNTRITALPEGILNSSSLYLLDAADNSLNSLPSAFLSSRLWSQGYVELTGNPLVYRQDAEAQALWRIPPDSTVPYKLRWLDRLAEPVREDFAVSWVSVSVMDGADNFMDLLAALTRSRDFINPQDF